MTVLDAGLRRHSRVLGRAPAGLACTGSSGRSGWLGGGGGGIGFEWAGM